MNKEEIILLTERIKKLEKRVTKSETDSNSKEKAETTIKDNGDGKIMKKFAEDIGLDLGEIKCLFQIDFENEDLLLLIEFKEGSDKENQFNATLCILTGYHYLFNKDEIKSSELKGKLEWIGIGNLATLGPNLNNRKKYLIGKGKPKSKKFSYEITYPGIKRGLEILANLNKKRNE